MPKDQQKSSRNHPPYDIMKYRSCKFEALPEPGWFWKGLMRFLARELKTRSLNFHIKKLLPKLKF
jgi:hypothetical protein